MSPVFIKNGVKDYKKCANCDRDGQKHKCGLCGQCYQFREKKCVSDVRKMKFSSEAVLFISISKKRELELIFGPSDSLFEEWIMFGD